MFPRWSVRTIKKTKISVMAAVWQGKMSRFRENSRHCYRLLYVFSKISFSKTIHKSLIHKCKLSFRSGTNYLKLDISKAKARLSWQPRWPLQRALKASVDWHQQWLAGANMQVFTIQQITQFQDETP